MEEWIHSLLLLEKLFNQTRQEMPFYNPMQQVIYNDDAIQNAVKLVKCSKNIPLPVQKLFDHWRRNQDTISLASWALEADVQGQRGPFLELLNNFLNLETKNLDLTAIQSVFENVKTFSDLNGKVQFIQNSPTDQKPESEFIESPNSQKANQQSWHCSKCWFKNGIQKVDGLWHRLCDFDNCGLCGAPKNGIERNAVARNTDEKSEEIFTEQKQDHETQDITATTNHDPELDDIIQKYAQNNLNHLSCSAFDQSNGDELCRDVRRMAEMLLKHNGYCKLVDHGNDARLEAKELEKYCDVDSYKSAVLRQVEAKESLRQTLKQHLDENTDEICEFGALFGFKGKRLRFIKFLKKYGKIKPGPAAATFRKVRYDIQKISLENWMKEVIKTMEYLQDHIRQKHLDGATETKREAIYQFFQSVIHSEDDDVVRNECLDHRKRINVEEEMENYSKIFDDIHSDLCHHQTVEEMWNDLINPMKTLSVSGMKELLTEHIFSKLRVDDQFRSEAQSLLHRAIESCQIDGKRILSTSREIVDLEVMGIFEGHYSGLIQRFQSLLIVSEAQLLGVEQLLKLMDNAPDCDLKNFVMKHFREHGVDGARFISDNLHEFTFVRSHIEQRQSELAEIWRETRNFLEMFNFQESCLIQGRAVNAEEKDYGHPQVHWIFKKYFMIQGVVCPDHVSLVHFAREHLPKFKNGVPGDLQKAMASYFGARDSDEERTETAAFVSEKIVAEKIRECSTKDLIALFTFQADGSNDDEKDAESRLDDGVFARFERNGGTNVDKMREIGDWKHRIVEWIEREKINGKMLGQIAI